MIGGSRPVDRRRTRTPNRLAGDHDEWMDMFAALRDEDVDALLRGEAPVDQALASVAAFARALRDQASAEPVPPMGDSLREQVAEAPVVVAVAGRRATSAALVKAAAVAVIAATVSVGAAQNRLPAGVQDVVSSTAGLVGVDVPRSEERTHPGSPGDEHRSDEGSEHGKNESAPNNDGGEPGYEGTTPGGAAPAAPGTPGDNEPATPAAPPEGNGQSSDAPDPHTSSPGKADGSGPSDD